MSAWTPWRAHLHEAVGNALEKVYQDREDLNLVVGTLAYHFQEAGIWEKAIDYRLRAGRLATQISANEEAIAHLAEGPNLLAHLPETPQRSRKELTLQTAFSVPLMTANGFASARVEQVAQRACDLAQTLGDLPQLFQALYGLWGFRLIRAELDLRLSQEFEHPYSVAYALEYGVTIGYQVRREVAQVRRWVEEGLDIARRHGFAFVAAHAIILPGWAIAHQLLHVVEMRTPAEGKHDHVGDTGSLCFLGHCLRLLHRQRQRLLTQNV
jgi:hypothetical protein